MGVPIRAKHVLVHVCNGKSIYQWMIQGYPHGLETDAVQLLASTHLMSVNASCLGPQRSLNVPWHSWHSWLSWLFDAVVLVYIEDEYFYSVIIQSSFSHHSVIIQSSFSHHSSPSL